MAILSSGVNLLGSILLYDRKETPEYELLVAPEEINWNDIRSKCIDR